MRAAPNKLLLDVLELKLVLIGCLLYHLLIYFDGLYFKQNGPEQPDSVYFHGKMLKKAFEIMLGY